MSFFGTAATSTTPAATADKDIEVPEPPSDSISSLSFSSAADYLAVGSWDNNVTRMSFISCRSLTRDSGSSVRGRRRWSDTGQGHVWPPRARTQRLLEQGPSYHTQPFQTHLSRPKRMATKSSLAAQTTPHACSTSQTVKQLKSRSMMRQ